MKYALQFIFISGFSIWFGWVIARTAFLLKDIHEGRH